MNILCSIVGLHPVELEDTVDRATQLGCRKEKEFGKPGN